MAAVEIQRTKLRQRLTDEVQNLSNEQLRSLVEYARRLKICEPMPTISTSELLSYTDGTELVRKAYGKLERAHQEVYSNKKETNE